MTARLSYLSNSNDIHLPSKSTYSPTAKHLYLASIGVLIFAMLLLCITVVLKLSALDFLIWNKAVNTFPLLSTAIDNIPFLDLSNYPILSDISWHRTSGQHAFKYYTRYFLMDSVLLAWLLLAKAFWMRQFERISNWLAQSNHRKLRITYFLIFAIGCTAFVTKAHLGFYWPGISGWTYTKKVSKLQSELPDSVSVNSLKPTFLDLAISEEPLKYYERSGYIKGTAQFLHFYDGQVLPFNDGLTGYIFPLYIFGKDKRNVQNQGTLIKSIKHALSDARDGKQMLLHSDIAYPRHTVYQHIDYTNYPSPNKIIAISFWEIYIQVDHHAQTVSVVSGNELSKIDLQNVE